jgi:hypothetical protein
VGYKGDCADFVADSGGKSGGKFLFVFQTLKLCPPNRPPMSATFPQLIVADDSADDHPIDITHLYDF